MCIYMYIYREIRGMMSHGLPIKIAWSALCDGADYQWGDFPAMFDYQRVPSGKLLQNYGKWKDPPFLMGKLTISMAIFNSYVSLPESKHPTCWNMMETFGTTNPFEFRGQLQHQYEFRTMERVASYNGVG